MNHKVRCQEADWDVLFPRGVEKTGRKILWPFLPWPLQGLVTVRTSVKRSCQSCVPLERSFPEKGRKSAILLQSAGWSQCTACENRRPPWEGCGLTCQPSHGRDGPLDSSGAPPNHPSALRCNFPLCSGISLASACLITPNAEEAWQGGAVRGRDRHCISLSWSFSVRSSIFVSNKKLHVQEALLWGRKKNTSRKHSWMDESHEEDSQHNQFSYKRNLKSSRWCIRETR